MTKIKKNESDFDGISSVESRKTFEVVGNNASIEFRQVPKGLKLGKKRFDIKGQF